MAEIALPGGRRIGIGKRRKVETIENPAWDYIKKVPADDLYSSGRLLGNGRFTPAAFEIKNRDNPGPGDFLGHRSRVTGRWTWAIPDPDTLEFILKILDGRPLVEIGAGNGYWSWLFSQLGVDVVAYDRAPVGHDDTWFEDLDFEEETRSNYWPGPIEAEEFFPVEQGGPEVLSLLDDCAERVLFLCWPNYDSDFAYDAMKAFRGDTVIYVGEGEGGCNANWKFWTLVQEPDPEYPAYGTPDDADPIPQEWEAVEHFPIVQWSGLHDRVIVYKRKR